VRDEFVERHVIQHRGHFPARRRQQRRIAIGVLLRDRMLDRILLGDPVRVPERLLHRERDPVVSHHEDR